NSKVLAALESDSVSDLKKRLSMIKSSADEQAANVKRVKSEYQSEELSIQAVVTQAGFIGNLLQPVALDYQELSRTIAGIEALNKGSALTDKVPQAQAIIKQARNMMEKDATMSAELYETYSNQADNLAILFKKYQTVKARLPKLRNHAMASNNLQEGHMERILSAIDRADNINFDQNALKRTIADVRRLRNTSEMAGAISDLYEAPQTVDTAQIKDLVHKAQQKWKELSAPNQAASDSLQNAQSLLQELTMLVENAEPLEDIADSSLDIETDVKLKGKLFAGKNVLQLSPEEISWALINRTIEREYIHKEFFGFKIPDTFSNTYCPHSKKLYKVLEKGTTTREWGGKHYKTPYFIILKLDELKAHLDFSRNWTQKLEEESQVKREIERKKTQQEKIEIIPYHLSNADESLIIRSPRNTWIETKLFARKDQLVMEVEPELEAWIGPIEGITPETRLSMNHFLHPNQYVIRSCGQKTIARCLYWLENQDKILGSLIDSILAEATPVMKKMANQFYFQPITFNLHFDGLIPSKDNSKHSKLRRNAGIPQNFSKRWTVTINKKKHHFSENYEITIWWNGELSYYKSIEGRINQLNESIDKRIDRYLNHPDIKGRETKISIASADYMRIMQRNRSFKSAKKDKFAKYQWSEHLAMRVANIKIYIDSDGISRNKDRQTRTREVAEKVVSIIQNSPKGW
ncbi:hypothetical protein KAJ27_18695, partial [bacterium]|nr:hypothetical protein [bacterium]